MRKVLFVSIKRLKIHEFDTTLRILLGPNNTWPRKRKILSELEKSSLQKLIKIVGAMVPTYLIASSLRSGNEITLELGSIEASLPAAFFFLFASFVAFVFSIHLNQYSVALSMKSRSAGKMLLHGFSINSYDALEEKLDDGIGIPRYQNNFLKEIVPISNILSFALLISSISLFFPAILYSIYFSSEQYMLINADTSIIEKASSASGIFFIAIAALNVIFFHLPLPMRKNKFSIRWGFLYRLAPHPSDQTKLDRWLEQDL